MTYLIPIKLKAGVVLDLLALGGLSEGLLEAKKAGIDTSRSLIEPGLLGPLLFGEVRSG